MTTEGSQLVTIHLQRMPQLGNFEIRASGTELKQNVTIIKCFSFLYTYKNIPQGLHVNPDAEQEP